MSTVPSGLAMLFLARVPRLKPWAIFSCPSGTDKRHPDHRRWRNAAKRQRSGALQNLAEFVTASNRAKRPGVSTLRSSESQNGHGTRWAVAATEDGRQSSGALGTGKR